MDCYTRSHMNQLLLFSLFEISCGSPSVRIALVQGLSSDIQARKCKRSMHSTKKMFNTILPRSIIQPLMSRGIVSRKVVIVTDEMWRAHRNFNVVAMSHSTSNTIREFSSSNSKCMSVGYKNPNAEYVW